MTASRNANRMWDTVLLSTVVLGVCLLPVSASARADEVPSHDLLPDDAVVLVEIDRPLRLLDHPLAGKVWGHLQESREYARRLDSPEYDQLRAIVEEVEREFGVGWRQALEKLTAGGIVLAAEEGTPTRTTLVLTADEPATVVQFGTFAGKLAKAQSPSGEAAQKTETKTHREHGYYKSDKACYAIAGRRLIATSGDEQMQNAIDRLLDGEKKPESVNEPAPSAPENAPLVRITVDMNAVRKAPALAANLKIPTANIAQVFLFGDWFDLVRRSDRLVIEIASAGEALELKARFSAPKSEVTPGLEGFFAIDADQPSAPLLKLPGTLYSTTWYRDYRAVWEGRSKLLVEASRKAAEEGEKQIEKQFALIGGGFLPSEMLRSIGTQFRVVLARQNQSAYEVDLEARYPAAVFVVNLRDEDYFQQKVVPVIRAGYGLATASQQPRIRSRESKYKEAELLSLVFDNDEASAAKGNRARYNISPTFTVTRGHFVAGSTREIVEQAIDELDRQAADKAAGIPLTSRQQTLLPAAAELAREFQSPLVRNIVLGQGLSIEDAEHELDVLLRLVSSLGEINVESGFDETGYEYRVKLGPAGK